MPGALLQRRDASPRGSRFPARPGAATQFCCSHARSRQLFRIDRQRAPLAFSNLMMITSRLAVVGLLALVAGCAGDPPVDEPPLTDVLAQAQATPTLGPDSQFSPSPYEDVGLTGLFPVHMPEDCNIAVLDSGEDSFAVRMQSLRNATKSIRIQALVFKGDEAGLRIAEVLKQKRAEGLDVRVIVDAFSNPWLQAQWMLFDLKQNGVEVEGYEALALQWINEVAVPLLTPHYSSSGLDNRYHEKMWIIDGETDHGIAVTGGLNIGNEYFRVDPSDPDAYWRDQDVVLKGAVINDLVTAFDRNFDYFVDIKASRGIFNTNLYWDATRRVLDTSGKVPIPYSTEPELVESVAVLEARRPVLEFRPARCRFIQSRPRLKETYIQQAYLKMIEHAQQEILIANAYFVPTPSITLALEDAAGRCVAIRLVSNSPGTNDLPEISMVGRGHYKSLLAINSKPAVEACDNPEAGIRIWEWVGQAADEPARGQGTMHSKFAVMDSRRSLVGSYNLDPRSEKLNSETAIVFEQEELAGRLRQLFLENDLRYSREVTLEQAQEFEDPQDVVYRFRDSIGKYFEEEL